jgi:hypothetical protein
MELRYNQQCKELDEVKYKDRYFEDPHSPIVHRIKGLDGDLKPFPMKSINPVMREDEPDKPPEQHSIINHSTPEQSLTIHVTVPSTAQSDIR